MLFPWCHDITAPKREQAQHYSLLTHKTMVYSSTDLSNFCGTYYLDVLFFSHSILHAIKKPSASTISMVLYNQALFRQANILDLLYCSCTKLHTECKTLAKTLGEKKKKEKRVSNLIHLQDSRTKMMGCCSILFWKMDTKLSQAECQMWIVGSALHLIVTIMLCEL